MKDLKSKVFKSVAFQFFIYAFRILLGILVVPIVVSQIGKSEFGYFEILLSFMLINFFLDLGLGGTLINYLNKYKQQGINEYQEFINTMFIIKFFAGLLGAIIVLLSTIFIDSFISFDSMKIKNDFINGMYIFALGVLIHNIESFFAGILGGIIRFDIKATVDIASKSIQILILVAIIYLFRETITLVTLAILWFIVTPLIKVLLKYFYVRKFEKDLLFQKKKITFSKTIFKEIISFLGGYSVITIFGQLYNQLPKLITGSMLGAESVAYLGVALRLRNPLRRILSFINKPLMPSGSLIEKKNPTKLLNIFSRIYRYQSLITIGLASFLLFFADDIIQLWVGSEFSNSANVLKIFLIPFLIPSSGILTMYYYSSGKTYLNKILLGFNLFAGVGIGSVFAFFYGLQGFVWALSISLAIMNMAGFIVYSRFFNINFIRLFYKGYGVTYSVVLATTLVLYITYKIYNMNLIFSMSIFLLIYATATYFMIGQKQRNEIIQLIKGIFN